MIDRGNLPEKLYRYQKFNRDHADRTKNLFLKCEQYYADPGEFDDPFDSKIEISDPGTANQWEEYFLYMARSNPPYLSETEARNKIRNFLRYNTETDILKWFRLSLEESKGSHRVLCLSELNDSLLMWSHYADGHHGFCLEFKSRSIFPVPDNEFQPVPIIIEYTEDYPAMNYFTTPFEEIAETMLLTKSREWRYEREWRIMVEPDLNVKNGIHPFPPEALTGVILGCAMDGDIEEKIRGWIEAGPANPTILKAKKKKYSFGLDFVP